MALICSSIVYWLVGLTSAADRFFIFTANLFMSLWVAESIMVLIAAVIPYFIVGIAVGAFLFGAFMCVQGFFIPLPQVGWWWRWMQFIALHYFSFANFMTNQYENTLWQPCDGGYPWTPDVLTGEEVLSFYQLESRLWVNFVALLSMVIIYRGLAMLWMHMFVRGKK